MPRPPPTPSQDETLSRLWAALEAALAMATEADAAEHAPEIETLCQDAATLARVLAERSE